MIGIYMYENKNTHYKYIGQSTNIERRRKEHINYPSRYSKIDQDLSLLGEDSFEFSILEECLPELLNDRERYWIQYYKSNIIGYNLTAGGQNYRGDANPMAKLSEQEVKEIIILLEKHKLNNKEIANIFQVSINTIDGINRCLNWTHLHNYKTNIRQENLNRLEKSHSSFAGENSSSSIITEEIALKIIKLLKHDNRSMSQISKDENVSINIIYDINRCKTWKYLHNYKHNIRNEFKKEVMPYEDN